MQAKFDLAFAAYVPEPTDCLDTIPYYRAFAGLKAAWGKDFYDRYNGAVHQAACTCALLPQAERYRVALDTVRYLANKAVLPERPNPQYSWDGAPLEPTEQDAYEFFKREFKRAYPDKRLNSRFAHEQWKAKRDLAMEIVKEEYQERLQRYQEKLAAIEQRNLKRLEEWQVKVDRVNEFKAAVASLEENHG